MQEKRRGGRGGRGVTQICVCLFLFGLLTVLVYTCVKLAIVTRYF